MQSSVDAVQGTANDALQTKISCVLKKYYDDPFVLEMEPKKLHRQFLPLINKGTFCRVYAITQGIYKILSEIKEQNVNIVILGSGLDTLYFNLMSKGYKNINVYEFDYDKLLSKKTKLIQGSKILSEIASGNSNYHLIPCDLTKISKLKSSIEKNFTKESKGDFTIIICECLFVYIERELTVEIINSFKSQFKNIVLFEYDLIGANDGYGKEMVSNLKMRNLTLRGYDQVPTNKEQIERLKECKFDQVEFVDLLDVYQRMLPAEERKRIDRLEMMDEFEEFDLMQRHSCFGYGLSIEDDKFAFIKDLLRIKK